MPSDVPRSSSWAVLLFSMGCAASCDPSAAVPPDPIKEACGGERPATITECKSGVFYADCGGDRGPILACHESTGRCKWFSHGCAPVGFRASACPIGNPCCESTSDGTWPFAESWRPVGLMGPVLELVEDVAAIGYAPVTASSPSGVVVMIDPSLTPAARGGSCDGAGAATLQACNGDPMIVSEPIAWGDTVAVIVVNTAISAEVLILEIVPGPDTEVPIARAFVRREHDASPPEPPLACEQVRSPRLDLTGMVTINALDIANPSATHGHLVLDLPGGGHAIVDF